MHITHLTAQHYRNIEAAAVSFAPGVNLLYGNNAEGKTNLLEAIYTFSRGKSFRGTAERDLVQIGKAGYAITGVFQTKKRSLSLSYRYENGVRSRYLNGAPVARACDMLGHARAVLFCPDHLDLLKGGPAERRLFLNIAISQLEPLYTKELLRYEKILRDRSALLRMAQKGCGLDRALYDTYSDALAASCAVIASYRRAYIGRLQQEAAPFLSDLSGGKESLTMQYVTDAEGESKEDYYQCLTEALPREIAAGCSLHGTHRDDLRFFLCGRDARIFASQGQMRSVVLALKLGEGVLAAGPEGDSPIYLFDDVLSELDEGRRRYLLHGAGRGQVIITSCERRGFEGVAAHEILVSSGTYRGEIV